jgi:excisionase family DNA binding protein
MVVAMEYLTTDQAAERLQVSVETVLRWLNAKRLQGTKLPGRAGWRIPADDVERLLRGEDVPGPQ